MAKPGWRKQEFTFMKSKELQKLILQINNSESDHGKFKVTELKT